jgi:hypothetical protein
MDALMLAAGKSRQAVGTRPAEDFDNSPFVSSKHGAFQRHLGRDRRLNIPSQFLRALRP